MSAMKACFRLPSAAFLLQRYAFLLKDARNFGKMFEGEGDKKKKVYPACPMYGARRIHLIIYVLYDASLEKTYASFFL